MNKLSFFRRFAIALLFCFIATTIVLLLSACGTSGIIVRASKDAPNYNINAIYNNDTKMLYATQSVDYHNPCSVDLNCIYLHLYPNAFRTDATFKPVSPLNEAKAYPNGFSSGCIEIKNVKVGTKSVTFEIGGEDNNILIIPLFDALSPKAVVSFSLEFSLQIPNIKHRFGWTENSINLGNWYPIICGVEDNIFQVDTYSYNGDPFFSDIANYNITLTVDDDFIVAHTGEQTHKSSNNGKTTYNFCAKAVRDFAFVMSTKFQHKSQKINNTVINYYYYSDTEPNKSLQTSVQAVETFNALFGQYPYASLSVVETGFVHGGMEFPNIVYISDNLENYEEYTNVIIHEIAHQWWFGVVGNNQVKEGWIDEGLAEYSTLLFYEKNPQYGIEKKESLRNVLNSYLLFIDVYNDIFDNVETTMTRSLDEYKTEPEYTYMAYVKSVLMLNTLEEMIGTQKFVSSLKYFYSQNAMKIATKQTYILAFEKCSNIPLSQFFDSWLEGKIVIQNP